MQPAPSLPAVEYAERSDPGRDPDKQINEDACGHRETRFGHLCVVCDGMGGHAAGREAAELALSTIFETFEAAVEGTPPPQVLRTAIEEASRRVHVMATSEVALGRPGSTTVAILLHRGGTEVAHIGDSRAYLVHGAQIFRVTRDHSIVQELVDHGLLTADQASRHHDANRITRALGMAPEVEAEMRPEPVAHAAGDAFVLCSDGLSDLVEDPEILAIVERESTTEATGKLVDLANARGGHDNITVLVLRAREGASPAATPGASTTATAVMPSTSAPAPTLIDPSPALPTEPAIPPSRELEPTPPPPSPSALAVARTQSPTVVAALALALGAFMLLGAVLVVHVAERRGKRNASNASNEPAPNAAPADAGQDGPTPLLPESIVVPMVSASSSVPIPPLEPAPPTRRKRKR
jgi:serine/threonine protein phosphatase PrpC